jgi:hypothetical protein
MADGHIDALNSDGEKLKQVLRLDSEKNVHDRYRWMRALEALRTMAPDLYQEGSSGESVGNLRVSALGLCEETVKLPAR